MPAGSALWVATVAFAGTNLDNALVTTAQVAAAPPHRVRRILAGQFAGFVTVVALAAGGAAVLYELPLWAVGFLGLVPIGLGIRSLLALRRRSDPSATPAEASAGTTSTSAKAGRTTKATKAHREPLAGGFFTAALVTVGNGGDNLAVYIPLLRQAGPADGALAAVWLLVLDGLLSGLVVLLGRHRRVVGLFERAGAWLTPLVYCAIGVLVLVRAGTLSHLF